MVQKVIGKLVCVSIWDFDGGGVFAFLFWIRDMLLVAMLALFQQMTWLIDGSFFVFEAAAQPTNGSDVLQRCHEAFATQRGQNVGVMFMSFWLLLTHAAGELLDSTGIPRGGFGMFLVATMFLECNYAVLNPDQTSSVHTSEQRATKVHWNSFKGATLWDIRTFSTE